MKRPFWLFVVLLASSACADDVFPSSGPVPILLPETFDTQLAKLPNVTAVMFYAPWCSHCKEFKPVFEGAAQLIKMNKLKLGVAAINADNNRPLAQKFGIKGFPTLKLFRDGAVVDEYRGSRTAEALVVWMESFQMDIVTNLTTVDQVKEFSAYRTVTLLGHFHPANAGAQKAFHDACKAVRGLPGYEHVRCAEIVDGKTATYFGLGETPAMKIVRKWKGSDTEGEKKTVEFDWFSSWNTKSVTDWVKTHSYPLLGEITPEVYGKLERRGNPLLWVFVPGHGTPPPHAMTGEHELPRNTPEQARANNATKKVAREVAKELGSRFTVVWLSGLDFPDQASSLGVDPSELPSVAIQTPSPKRERFAYDRSVYGPISKESIVKFASDFEAKQLKPFVKSQPVPLDTHEPGQVLDLVALNFNEQVFASDKDVFVMFYAPWCQHCQQAEPVWRELAARLVDASDIVIARIDATANDVPREIPGFPTFYLKKASNKKVEIDSAFIYDGERTIDAFLAFIKERGSTKALADFKPPADVRRVSYFLSQLDSTKTDIEKLIKENEELREQLKALKTQAAQCGGSATAGTKTRNKDEL